MKFSITFLITITLLISSMYSCKKGPEPVVQTTEKEVFISPLGKKLAYSEPSDKMMNQLTRAKQDFEKDQGNVDNIIWYGRRTAYLGKYEEAIKIYSDGIAKFRDDPRLYRHRGHRYISIRKIEQAIHDFEKAGQLIQGKENEIEPDGMPNAMNIPISTLHGNIWYHLGLAYYLRHDYEKSFETFMKCRDSGNNDDNIVSSTHWLYMNAIRMKNDSLADSVLEPIQMDARIIENTNYYNLCKLYKGLMPLDSLLVGLADNPSGDAVKYGLSNWYAYKGDVEKSRETIQEILAGKSWTSFGYIAAESDFIEYFKE
jgi:tetratricopeptide (TPR) repeat protein